MSGADGDSKAKVVGDLLQWYNSELVKLKSEIEAKREVELQRLAHELDDKRSEQQDKKNRVKYREHEAVQFSIALIMIRGALLSHTHDKDQTERATMFLERFSMMVEMGRALLMSELLNYDDVKTPTFDGHSIRVQAAELAKDLQAEMVHLTKQIKDIKS